MPDRNPTGYLVSFASFCIIYLFTSDGEATLTNFMKLGLTHVCGEGGGGYPWRKERMERLRHVLRAYAGLNMEIR